MPRFTAKVQVGVPAPRVWERLTDWPAHGRWVAFTKVRVLTPGPNGVGTRFVGRTGVGPLGFDDPMEVTEWVPATSGSTGVCAVVKQGRVITGSARFEVVPRLGGSARVVWTEDVSVVPHRLSAALGPVGGLLGRLVFTRVLRRMARELEAERR